MSKSANLVSELVRFGGEVGARRCFDSTMRRLRTQLNELELREDLVYLDGGGSVELVLRTGEQIVDET